MITIKSKERVVKGPDNQSYFVKRELTKFAPTSQNRFFAKYKEYLIDINEGVETVIKELTKEQVEFYSYDDINTIFTGFNKSIQSDQLFVVEYFDLIQDAFIQETASQHGVGRYGTTEWEKY